MPELWQTTPWGTPPPDDSGPPPDWMGGQQPAVMQAIGATPAPIITPASPSHPDFAVPASAFGQPPPVQAPVPVQRPLQAKPLSFGQQMAKQQQNADVALGEHGSAINAETAAQQGLHSEQGQALAQNLSTFNAAEESRKQAQDSIQKAHMANQAVIDSDRKAIDNYKIDPDQYMNSLGIGDHIRYGIGAVLAGIGQGMMRQGGPNPVVQMMQDKIKTNIELQKDKRDQMLGKLGRDIGAQSETDKTGASRIADIERGQAVGETVLAKQFQIAGNNAADPISKANALKAHADLLDSANAHAEKFVALQSQHDYQQQELGIQGARLGIAARAENRAQKLQELEWGPGGIQEQTLGIKAAAEARKEMQGKKDKVKEEGIFNPNTGLALYTDQGNKMIAQADQYEAKARKDPANAQQYTQRAEILRNDAKTTEVETIPKGSARDEVIKSLGYSQDLIDATGKIKAFLKSDPEITNREGWATVQTLYGDAIKDYAKSFGANASSREFSSITDHIMKYDPDSMIDRAFRKAPGISGIEGLETSVKGAADHMLKGHGVTSGWIPTSPEDSKAVSLGARTGDEAAAAAEPSNATKFAAGAIDTLGKFATGGSSMVPTVSPNPGEEWESQKAAREASDQANPSPYGLPKETDVRLQGMIKSADTASNAKYKQIIEQIVDPIKNNSRPSLSMGILRTVKDQNPQMYEDILSQLPPMQAAEIRQFDTPSAALEPTGTNPRKSTINAVEQAKKNAAQQELDAMKNRR